MEDPLRQALATFATAVQTKLSALAPGEPEDQIRAPAESLLEDVGAALGKTVVAKGESLLPGRLGKPDYAVLVDAALTGYVEIKALGRGANPNSFPAGHDREQWKRFKSIPNLIYTDGNEWALYRNGSRVGEIVRLPGNLAEEGADAVSAEAAASVASLLTDFFSWNPIVPTSPKQLAEVLAPLCRLLRDQVRDSLQQPASPLVRLAADWRYLLFPEADDHQFADAYAQTVTYALLLARAEGAPSMEPATAAATLGNAHALLSRALQVLTDPAVEVEIGSALALLTRTIAAVDPTTMEGGQSDPWLYFYEDFLAAYDPKLRKDAGVYYTPVEVVRAQVRIADELLRTRLGRAAGFADADVRTLDPAVGTGTYLIGTIAHALAAVEKAQGPGAVPGRATTLGTTLHGFEFLVGPYAVAQLRLSRELESRGATLPEAGPHIYLTDTLEDPATAPTAPPLFYAPIAQEHARAQEIKEKVPILVCLGNPPYDRHDAASPLGGWVRHGAEAETAPLENFLAPARDAGHGVHLKNLYNLYVYFWRWAVWKVFEQDSATGPGIVTFISASSYLSGPGFVGMRELLRRECDNIWVIDLGGEGRGARKDENLFAIQVPVAIAIAARHGDPLRDSPAEVHYTRIRGDRPSKLDALDGITSLDDLTWEACPSDWQAPFRPVGVGSYFDMPALTDVFPWRHTGVEVKRSWPIGPDRDTLRRRWEQLLAQKDRGLALHETRDRKVTAEYASPCPAISGGPPIESLPATTPPPSDAPYAFRSLDRQRLLADNRVVDYVRPALWNAHSGSQAYLTTLLTTATGAGPAVFACGEVPDRHHFRGSFGGADVFPLWRDAEATMPNVLPGLLELLANGLGRPVTPEDLFAYVYAVIGSSAYSERFDLELEEPGPRVPLTLDPALFGEAIDLGAELLFLHTYGERYVTGEQTRGSIPDGAARSIKAISQTSEDYPADYGHDEEAQELRVGDGVFAPVSSAVWSFEVSGRRVVDAWLAYRMRERAGRKSSPLDSIQPERWTTDLTDELLVLLWIVEKTIELGRDQEELLDRILDSELLLANELDEPPKEARKPLVQAGEQTQLDGLD
jgi:hypothetical protein